MNQLNNSSTIPSQMLHSNDDEIFTYKGSSVKIITVFSDSKGSIALVEDENGELFEVPRDSLNDKC